MTKQKKKLSTVSSSFFLFQLHEPISKHFLVCILSIWKSKDKIISSIVTKSEKSFLHKNMLNFFFFNHFIKLRLDNISGNRLSLLSICIAQFIIQQNLHINALELLSIIVCLKLWGQKGKKICIQCDNMVSVLVINQGKSRSCFLQECLREICFICAVKECELRAIHIDSSDNRLPDMLSRRSLMK
jgi:hypothetical protein